MHHSLNSVSEIYASPFSLLPSCVGRLSPRNLKKYIIPLLLPRKKEAVKISSSSSSSSEEEEEASTEGIFLSRDKNYNLNNSKKILNSISESRLIAIEYFVFEIIEITQFIKLKLPSKHREFTCLHGSIDSRRVAKSGLSGIVFAKFAEQLGNYYLDSKVVGYTYDILCRFLKRFARNSLPPRDDLVGIVSREI